MLLSMISAAALGFMAVHMLRKATLASTRRVALVAAAMFLIEVAATGLLSVTQFPVLTAILVAMRLTVLLCCVKALRRDAAIARAKARKRRVAAPERAMPLCA